MFVAPMLARASTLPADESAWGFEVKWDGVRAIAHCQPSGICLFSRRGNDITGAYPELRSLAGVLGSHTAILDGEIVAFDGHGRPSFEALQPRMHLRGAAAVGRLAQGTPVTYLLFDLLWLDGHSLMELPYAERRERLAALALNGEHWRTPAYHAGEGAALLAATREQGLEGVVAKRLNSRYLPGARGEGWLKIKHARRQEVLIGGWTEGKGTRLASIGALQVGVHDEQGLLRYAGRVGTGFNEQTLAALARLMRPLARKESPFIGRQPPRGAHFVQPRLVCEVEFTEWTKQGLLRHPSYKGLREDKAPAEVLREDGAAGRVREDGGAEVLREDGAAGRVREDGGAEVLREDGAIAEAPARPPTPRRRARGGVEVVVADRTLKLTNLEKVLYPQCGFTKGNLIHYYSAIAPVLLPHLRGHPLTLKRYPDGVEGEYFYEKQCPAHRPQWVHTTAVWSARAEREIDYCLCEDLPTLVWLANQAAVELHPSLALAHALERPSALAFDLDPGAPAGIMECCEVALLLRDLLAELELRAFVKTSGSKGLQVYVPLNEQHVSYEHTKSFARAVAQLLARHHRELVVWRMDKAGRVGRVLIDWSQNDEHKTTVSVYSLRGAAVPLVSAPVSWEEVASAREARDPTLLELSAAQVLERVRLHGDLFGELVSLRQALPALGT
jgi:bifunctional non-homologous end joining protein LigD